eukprot:6680290-Prymnesium_polylepis.2
MHREPARHRGPRRSGARASQRLRARGRGRGAHVTVRCNGSTSKTASAAQPPSLRSGSRARTPPGWRPGWSPRTCAYLGPPQTSSRHRRPRSCSCQVWTGRF